MITFDRVLPELLRVCETHARRDDIRRVCVVRDVRGRVRLAVEPKPNADADLSALEKALVGALDKYFAPPLLSTEAGSEVHRLAKGLFDKAKGNWPANWPLTYETLLGGSTSAALTWTGIERTIAKEAWLDNPRALPWRLIANRTPPIVTFHSFKGGVGRTTLVAAHSIRLASEGRRVAVVDLDLEAPGLGTLFGVQTTRGVLDILVDHMAQGTVDTTDASNTVYLGDQSPGHISVFPAGSFDERYLAKLARLDYSSTEPGANNPVGEALTALLKNLKGSFDFILLDARAGLHDLAGMSLHGLAHVDVLVFRGTNQNFDGLAQTFRTLESQDPDLVLVETLLPSGAEEFEFRRERTRARIYQLLIEHLYPESDPPQPSDIGAAHDVLHVRRKEWLEALETVDPNSNVAQILADSDLAAVSKRINEECVLAAAGGENPEVNQDQRA